jgi:peptide/nickel transport system permease protein
LLAVSALSFVLAETAPGSLVDEVRLDPRISPATLAAMRDRYGLDEPLPQKYLRWLQSIWHRDFGYSVIDNQPVAPLLRPRIRNPLLLTVAATALAWVVALLVGAWAAGRKGEWPDRLAAAGTTVLLSVPDLLVGLFCLLLAVRTGNFPTGGLVSIGFNDLGPAEKLALLADGLRYVADPRIRTEQA